MCRVPQNIRNYFTNYTQRLTPSTVPMDSKQLGDALRNARNQPVSSQKSNRDENDGRRVQVQGITELNSHGDATRVQVHEPRSVSQTNCTKSTHPRGITMRAQDARRNSMQRKLKAFRSHGFENNERYRQNQNMPTQRINY